MRTFYKQNVSYSGIHKWVGKRLPNKGVCSKCKEIKPTELSCNIKFTRGDSVSVAYREFNYWEWLCKSCHAKKDEWGNLEKAHTALRGKKPWNYGKKAPEETRQKLSDSHKGKHHAGTFKKGQSPWTKGRKLSEEHKRKIGLANKISLKKYYSSLI